MKGGKKASKRTTAMTVASPPRALRTPVPLSRVRDGVNGAKKKTAQIIARNPFRVVAGALALGFVFAKLKAIF
jgi:hypothetical protein